jgi:Zn-dependent protease
MGGRFLNLAVFFVSLFAGAYLNTLLHETGHALSAWGLGFSLYAFAVGPLTIRRTRRGVQFALNTARLFGGSIHAFPTYDRFLRARYAVMVACGPLTTLLLAAPIWRLGASLQSGGVPDLSYFALVTSGLANDPFSAPTTMHTLGRAFLSALLINTAMVGVVSGLFNLFPYKGSKQKHDGWHILTMLRGGPRMQFILADAVLERALLKGAQPRRWPESMIWRMVLLAQVPGEKYRSFIHAYYWALDKSEIDRAGVFLDAALASSEPPFQPSSILALEAAYFEARYRANGAMARAWLGYKKPKSDVFMPVLAPRAEAAMLLLEGFPAEARRRAWEGLAALADLAPRTFTELHTEEESLRALAAEAEQARKAPVQAR